MITYPEIDPVIISIGFLKIRWYGLMYLIGFVVAILLAKARTKKTWSPVKYSEVDDLIFYCMLGVILGGRLGYVIFYGWHQLISDPLYIFRIMEGGMSFHGGLIGVIAALWLYGRKIDKDMITMMDFVAPIVPLGLGFGRIGNFINGELWGRKTDISWGVLFPQAPDFALGIARHPSQIYAALLEGLVVFIYVQFRFWKSNICQNTPGRLGGEFLVIYAFARIIGEFFREPDASLIIGMSRGQFYSIFLILGGVFVIFLAQKRKSHAL